MRPTMTQTSFTGPTQGPPDYRGTEHSRLSRRVWLALSDAGGSGASAAEVATTLGHPVKSVAGRLTELSRLGYVRRTEAWRSGTVYVAVPVGHPW